MYDRKTIKQQARQHLRRHYVLITVLCALSIFLGTEFTGIVSNAQIWYDALTGQVTLMDTVGVGVDKVANTKLLDDYIADNITSGREKAAERIQALKESTDPRSVMGRQRGILAAMMNSLNSGQLTVTLGLALHSIVHSDRAVAVVMILLSTALTALAWIFLRNLYRAVLRRAVLESRVYEALPLGHIFHIKAVRRWVRASLTLLWQTICEWLWWLTLAGGLIKHYSYFLVPFIVAENPDIRPREALLLSRRMMNGHKWECCKLHLSFLGWMLLGFVTFGAAEALWGVPYRVAAYAEYYARLRADAKAQGIPSAELLNDDYLFAPAPEELLRERYADIVRREDIVDIDIVDLPPVRRFFARNFGLWVGSLDEKKVYSRQEGLRQQMRVGQMELGGKAYPQRLNPLWHKEAAALTGRVSYVTPLTFWSLAVVFFSFSLIGWLYEVGLYVIAEGMLVNRGMLHGPWLPIYGGGVSLIAVLLYRFRKNPALEALTIVVLCGIVEYVTSYAMELAFGIRWWDYTGYFLNLNGRICGEGLVVFALGGMAAVYLLVPVIDGAVTRIKPKILIPVCVALLVCFTADLVWSQVSPNTGEGITDYEQVSALPEEGGTDADLPG